MKGMSSRTISDCPYEMFGRCLVGTDRCLCKSLCYSIFCVICEAAIELPDDVPQGFDPMDPRTKYLGTTGRSAHCRSLEHQDLFRLKSKKSPLYKHTRTEHPELCNEDPADMYRMEVLTTHRSTLTRLATEALLIEHSDQTTLLNSKNEWGGTKLVRHRVEAVMF